MTDPGARRISSPAFVGRARELERIDGALERAAERPVLLIAGEAGVGKSRLLLEATERASARGVLVLVGRCTDLGGGRIPFQPFTEALGPVIIDRGEAELEAVLGAGATAVRAILATGDGWRAVEAADGEEARGRSFEQIGRFLDHLTSGGPVLLALEDLHWADASTRDLVRHLAQRSRGGPLVIAATFRTDELSRRHPLLPTLAEIERTSRGERIDVGRFESGELRTVIEAIVGTPPPDDLVARILARSDGNAFHAEELLAAERAAARSGRRGHAALPSTLDDVLRARLDRLSEPARYVVATIALAGTSVEAHRIDEVTGLPTGTVIDALREALDLHVLVAESETGRYLVRHALLSEVAVGGLVTPERIELHARIAASLRDRLDGAPGPVGDLAALAYHAAEAHDRELAIRAGVRAAEEHVRRLAYPEARALLEDVVAAWGEVPNAAELTGLDMAEVLHRASTAASYSTDGRAAVALGRRALDALPDDTPIARRGTFVDDLGVQYFRIGDGPGAIATVEAELPRFAGPPSEARALLLADLGIFLWLEGRLQASRRALEQAVAEAEEVDSVVARVIACSGLSQTMAELGWTSLAVELAERAVESAPMTISAGRRPLHHEASVYLGIALFWAGRLAESAEILRATRAAAEVDGTDSILGDFVLLNLGDALGQMGELDEARAILMEIIERPFESPAVAWARIALAWVAHHAGDLAEARAQLGIADAMVTSGPSLVWASQVRVKLLAETGSFAEIETLIDEMLAAFGPDERGGSFWDMLGDGVAAASDAAQLLRLRHQDRDVAAVIAVGERWAAAFREIMARSGPGDDAGGWMASSAAQVTAELGHLHGRGDHRLWAAEAAVDDAARLRYRATVARLRQAASLLERGDRRGATAVLREAHRAAGDHGFARLTSSIEALAARARLRLDDSSTSGVAEIEVAPVVLEDGVRITLTPREREILALLAQGLTNREIGEHLFISEKTASVHVSNAMGKLGARSRFHAAGIASSLGLVDPPVPGDV